MGYGIPDDPPDRDLTPQQLHDRIDEVTNLSADELRAFKDSDFNATYNRVKSDAAQPGDEPLDDVIRLLGTPASEYRDVDDGFNEVTEANQALSFLSRMKGVESGSPISGTDPPLSKRDMSLYAWGFDPDQNDG